MTNERVRGNLDLMLLQILAGGVSHGYAVVCELRERSAGAFDLPEGTVYPALHRLERQGLLQSTWDLSGPRRRRLYALSRAGRTALRAERREWDRFVGAVGAVLGSPA
ncbi:MAG: helix-turn-helix transcriptional regulator [Mycobacteriales bacterium]